MSNRTRLAKSSGAIVVPVDYRQAPEHKFPAAWDDALAAYRWLAPNAASLGGDVSRLALADRDTAFLISAGCGADVLGYLDRSASPDEFVEAMVRCVEDKRAAPF